MKNNKVCPKCSSTDILRVHARSGHDNRVPIPGLLGLGFKRITITRYICGSCGYCEEWVDSQEDLQKLKDGYDRA